MELKINILTCLLAIISLTSSQNQTTTKISTTTTKTPTTTTTGNVTTVASSSATSPSTLSSSTSTVSANGTYDKKVEIVEQETFEGLDHLVSRPIANTLNTVFSWADHHFPLVVKILELTKSMSDSKLQQIPGVKIFLEILSEATHWHLTKDKLRNGTDFANHTLEKVVEEFSKHHNYSIKDIPFLKNVTEKIVSFPAVRDLVKTSLTTKVNGVPFALTLVFLLQHLGTKIPVSQWANFTVHEEIRKNLTREFFPFFEIQFNKTINKLNNHTHQVIRNITDFSSSQVKKLGQVVLNISDHTWATIKNITATINDYHGNHLNRTQIMYRVLKNLTKSQLTELADFLNKTRKLPGQFFSSPYQGFTHMSDNTLDMFVNTFGKITNFTVWLNRIAWSNLEDIGNLGLKARDLSLSQFQHATNLGIGVAKHAYHSIWNLSEITMNMSPLQIFKFKGLDDLIKSRIDQFNQTPEQNKTNSTGFLTSLPIVGNLPGVSVIQSLLNQFPQLIFLNFNQVMKIFDIFRGNK